MSGKAQLEGHVAAASAPFLPAQHLAQSPVHGRPWDPVLSPAGQGVWGCAAPEG